MNISHLITPKGSLRKLYYTEICLSPYEVPGEQSICIYISGCLNRCRNCHYPELQYPDYGDVLSERMSDIVALYRNQASCVCFMGEGRGGQEERDELIRFAEYAHKRGLKTCLYSGRDTFIEAWMKGFDYIKIGSYQEALGALDSNTTNQRMYRKNANGEFEDITCMFRCE